MPAQSVQRVWNEEAGCGFCLRSEPGGVWCRGLCRNVSLLELTHRIDALRYNATRLDMLNRLPVKPGKLQNVPACPTNARGFAVQHRAMAGERMIRSLQRLHKSGASMALSAERLEATARALADTRNILNAEPADKNR